MKKVNIRKQLKYILKEYGIKQEELYYRFGWYFNEVNNELLEDLKRQLGITESELNYILYKNEEQW